MKVKEYYNKYLPEMQAAFEEVEGKTPPDMEKVSEVADKIWCDLNEELRTMTKARKVTVYTGLLGIARELNDRWNGIDRLFEKEFGISILKYNGIIEGFKKGTFVL